jgi:hypothetical protein
MVQPLRIVDGAKKRPLLSDLRHQAQRGEAYQEAIRRVSGPESERDAEGIALGAWQMIHMIEHRRTELLQGRVSKLHLGLDADRPHHLKPRCRLNRIIQQRSLADPGLATQDKRAALPGACRAEQLIQRCAFRETI